MKISELIEKLEALKTEFGDIETKTQTLRHLWDPDPQVREAHGHAPNWVLLNP